MRAARGVVAFVACLSAQAAGAQTSPGRFEAGVQLAVLRASQFDTADVGLGGRLAWRPAAPLGLEAELNLYPRHFPDDRPFSRARVEALFGATARLAPGRVSPFARLRAGFVTVREAPEPFPCILIFPPPLACALAAGRTLAALDIGGGVEIEMTPRAVARIDVGDRLIRYPGPVFAGTPPEIRDEPFFGHDFRVATGVGFRF